MRYIVTISEAYPMERRSGCQAWKTVFNYNFKLIAQARGFYEFITYMRLAGVGTGLLINFNVKRLRDGIKRFVL